MGKHTGKAAGSAPDDVRAATSSAATIVVLLLVLIAIGTIGYFAFTDRGAPPSAAPIRLETAF